MEDRRIILASTSRVHGTGYLDHLEPYLQKLFGGVERLGQVTVTEILGRQSFHCIKRIANDRLKQVVELVCNAAR